DSGPLRDLLAHIDALAAGGAFERAARLRDRAATLVRILARQQELAATAAPEEMVLVQAGPRRSWAVAVIRHGRLAASGTVPGATTVPRGTGPLAGATPAQVGAVHRWIDAAPTRIVSVRDARWEFSLDGARSLTGWADRAEKAAAEHPVRAGG